MEKDIYSMELHEEISITPRLYVVRVAGGWIYQYGIENGTGGYDISMEFVPYNNEFQE